ncbi:MmgE/PrpD family protein [Chloroflexota bacterium]
MTVARNLARYVTGLTFSSLPPEVVHQVKRLMVDTLGCAIGGYASDASKVIQEVVKELGGPKESTIIGSGAKTSCLNAALANGAMVRYLDYNDVACLRTELPVKIGAHPSEVMPPILALGERHHLTGKEVIAAIVAGYELSARFMDSVVGASFEERGWSFDIRGAYIMPLLAGKILGLTEEQMENAVGICGSYHVVFGITDTPAEEYTMAKNIRFPSTAYGGIMAAMLAQKGFTGPTRMIEGHDGFVEVIMKGDFDLDRLTRIEGKFKILDTAVKPLIACYPAQGHLSATLKLVNEHDIRPEDVVEVRVRAGAKCVQHTGDPVKKYPANKETADHSSYYLTAISIFDRQLGPEQFTMEKFADPRVRELIDKVILEGDEELDKIRTAGIVEITTGQGARHSCRVDYPRGHPLNPMMDEEIVNKFRSMATKYMTESQIKQLINTIFELDKLDDIGDLMKLLVFKH